MMHDSSKHVGLDVHKDTIAVAIAGGAGVGGGEVRSWGTIENRPAQVKKLVKALSPHGEVVRFYYEAGPCGYGLHRQLTELGHPGAPGPGGGAVADSAQGGGSGQDGSA